jgi:para-aminobenzoate synthetase/4-amino-4-deoxychorismate lyase
VEARRLADVLPAVREVRRQTDLGRWAAGFLAYEAAPAFDSALAARPPGALPLLWFALFGRRHDAPAPPVRPLPPLDWRTTLRRGEYRRAFAQVRRRIAAGETYQVNYTYRMRARARGVDAGALFGAMVRGQGARFGVLLDAGPFAVLSASPELFFRLEGERVVCRPMKGTAPRGLTPADDRRLALALRASEKERAENVMIVDMVRNDLGRVARTGSVRVPRLFTLERYPTLWQMTSTVTASTGAPLEEILAALFPSASITGAPKVRTSALIAALESTPRGVYCGAAGVLGPRRRSWLNVAIRTATLDRRRGRAEYGTGSGVTWDARAAAEEGECRTKTLLLGGWSPPFSLLETMVWVPRRGLLLLRRHLDRLRASAAHLDIPCDARAVRARLRAATRGLTGSPHKVRLLVDDGGAVAVECAALPPGAGRLGARPPSRGRAAALRVAVSPRPVDRGSPFLYHKTTRREVYERARAAHPGCDEVLLVNEAGELTEATTANLVLRLGDELLTPPVSCGLLPGTFRAHLLARGAVRERVLTAADLEAADAVYLVNSVRGWRRCAVTRGGRAGCASRTRGSRAARSRSGRGTADRSPGAARA